MNYRHAFHAGNFADVVKHAVLARIVLHLRKKEAAFRIIDTHAGSGMYDLGGAEARRAGEWHGGIARVMDANFDVAVSDILAPYLDAVRGANPDGKLARYPGSPVLVRSWLRPQDRLIACELEPQAAGALARQLRGDERIKAIEIDGWTALMAYIPPKERRGLVLIDPPFEEPNEFARLADALLAAHGKWPAGIYLAWYPIKDSSDSAAFARKLARSDIPKLLQVEVTIAGIGTERLRGTGLIVINPPWTLESELRVLLPALTRVLAPDGRGTVTLQPLSQ
jgi:23S rRNA (adenine2030-N6)-methyltransferase